MKRKCAGSEYGFYCNEFLEESEMNNIWGKRFCPACTAIIRPSYAKSLNEILDNQDFKDDILKLIHTNGIYNIIEKLLEKVGRDTLISLIEKKKDHLDTYPDWDFDE